MIKVLHVSTECYPAAKAGGMGDVVGALPLYAQAHDIEASVVIPMYDLPFFSTHSFEKVFKGSFKMGPHTTHFSINRLQAGLPFPFYAVDIPGRFDRASVYLDEDGEGFQDEIERNAAFQRAVLDWLHHDPEKFDIVHCHDHQAGLIPFFMAYGWGYGNLKHTPTYFTIHNAAYRGMWLWQHKTMLPPFDHNHVGLLDWDNHIHSLASAIKCCWGYNTVSPTYLEEIRNNSGNLNWLYNNTSAKATGILNGIDTQTWDPANDPFIYEPLKRSWTAFKTKNRSGFRKEYGLPKGKAVFSFIGRLAHQKGADILAEALFSFLSQDMDAAFILLGSGNRQLEDRFRQLEARFGKQVKTFITYDESLAHKLYAISDFLVMPSRFEPCGLNQMFAKRYGTIPVVRSTGGLKDTVLDIRDGGTGIRFDSPSPAALTTALKRASELYSKKSYFDTVRKRAAAADHSWHGALGIYKKEYDKILKNK